MTLLIILILLSIVLGIILVYFTGLVSLSPFYWFLIIPIGLLASGLIISIAWGGFLFICLKYRNKENNKGGNMFYQTLSTAFAKLLLLGTWSRLHRKGFGKIPKKEPCLYLFNHTSFVDCWMLLSSIHPHRFAIVADKAMKKVPLMGNLATALGTVFVDRENPISAKKMIETSVDYLTNKKTSIALSPEGRVNRSGELYHFKNGGFKIAISAKCPIVLLSFKGIGQIDKRKHFWTKCPISATVIDVISPDIYQDMNASELGLYCEEIYRNYQKIDNFQ